MPQEAIGVTSRQEIRAKVRDTVYRTLGLDPRIVPAPRRPLVTELDIRDLPFGSEFQVPPGALITPLARQVAMDRHIRWVGATAPAAAPAVDAPSPQSQPAPAGRQAVAIGADHGGYRLKESLKGYLGELGQAVIDCGTAGTDPVDYPDFALAVAELVAQGRAWRGIVIDGAGIGSCITANKVPGVRAAMCYDQSTAINSREHNDANVLTLGAGLIGENLARQIVKVWIETPFGGGRHARRVDKIKETERRFARRA
jgi:ribose 5-phosphate isomerase B